MYLLLDLCCNGNRFDGMGMGLFWFCKNKSFRLKIEFEILRRRIIILSTSWNVRYADFVLDLYRHSYLSSARRYRSILRKLEWIANLYDCSIRNRGALANVLFNSSLNYILRLSQTTNIFYTTRRYLMGMLVFSISFPFQFSCFHCRYSLWV